MNGHWGIYTPAVTGQNSDYAFDDPNVDIVNRHVGKNLTPFDVHTYIQTRWHKRKAVNIDEFGNGWCELQPGTNQCAVPLKLHPTAPELRNMAWTIVGSGGHFH